MNRRILFTACLVLVTALSASAQFRLGPIGGLNFYRQVYKSNTYRYEAIFQTQMSFNAGMIGDFVINRKWSIQPELLYTRKGGIYKTDRAIVNEEYRANLGYVMMPVCATYKIDLNKAYFFLGAGPYAAKLLSSAHSFYSDGKNIENGPLQVGTNFTTDQIKPWDFGVKLKAGFEMKKGMYMGAYYDIGAYDINPQFTVTRNKTYGIQWAFIFSTSEEDRYERFENFYEF